MGCKGQCLGYVVDKQSNKDGYKDRKRCHTCNVWVSTDDLKCDCCGKRFRTKKR